MYHRRSDQADRERLVLEALDGSHERLQATSTASEDVWETEETSTSVLVWDPAACKYVDEPTLHP